MNHGKPFSLIGPELACGPARFFEQFRQAFTSVFITVLGVDPFALTEAAAMSVPADQYVVPGLQVHLDPAVCRIEQGDMLPVTHIEIRAEDAVDVAKDIQVECTSDAQGIVARCQQYFDVLDQVYPKQ